MNPVAPEPERHVLLAALAAHRNLVPPAAALDALRDWALDKSRPAADRLEAAGLPAGERGRLEAAVDELLRAAGPSLAGDPAATLPTFVDPTGWEDEELTRPRPGAGPRYHRLRLHARGGLGEVYAADDAELNRRVALKELRPEHAGSRTSRARFVAEAEITGNLEHPGIVPVYGLGAHPDGRPFYAMRLIHGETLAEAVSRLHAAGPVAFAGAQVRQLLRRLVDVCNAVAYAHSRGVIHRDIKPANVMLGPFGETLLVDWGMAKALGRPDPPDGGPTPGPADPSHTWEGQLVGTPAFMSPEQASGDSAAVGPLSDVYSLGATLYVLLTGRPPVAGADGQTTLARVAAGDVPAPRAVNPRVPGPLDAICRKAMARRPADRYPSPLTLAADLERWLADEPVSCFTDPLAVSLTRWGRRNRSIASAAAALLITATAALTAGLAAVARERDRTAAARDRAESALREKDIALQQREAALHEKDGALGEKDGALAALTDQQAKTQTALTALTEQKHKTDEALAAQTKARHDADAAIGRLRGYLNPSVEFGMRHLMATTAPLDPKDWEALNTMARYAEDLRATPADTPPGRAARATGAFVVGFLATNVNKPREAVAAYAEAVRLYRDLAGLPGGDEYRDWLCVALTNLARSERRLRGPDDAEADKHLLEAARVVRETDWSAPAAGRRFATNAAYALADLAARLASLGRPDDARGAIDELVRFRRARIAARPDWSEFPAATAKFLQQLARRLPPDRWRPESRRLLTEARDAYEAEVKRSPSSPAAHTELAVTLTTLGSLDVADGDWPGACKLFDLAEQQYRSADRLNRVTQLGYLDRAFNRIRLGEGRLALRDHAAAAAVAEQYARDGFVLPGEDLATGAGLLAQCVPLAEADEELPPPIRTELARRYAARAMDLLTSAVEKGYRDASALRAAPRFAALRDREDFRELVQRVEERARPR